MPSPSRTSTFEEPGAAAGVGVSVTLPRPSPSPATICARRSGPTGGGGRTGCLTCSRKIDADVVALQEADKRMGGRGVGGSARADRRAWPLQAGAAARPPPPRARTLSGRNGGGEAAQPQHPQPRLARQCAAGEGACRNPRRRRARPADARAARRGDGGAAGPRPAGAGHRHASRPFRPVAAAADAGDHGGDRSARRTRCRRS